MTSEERALLTGLMIGLDVPPSSARRPAWMADGACLEHPEVQFVPPNQNTEAIAEEARAICGHCLCRAECRDYSLADVTLQGGWGATTRGERGKMRKRPAA